MAQTSVDFANSKPERRNLAILLREKKVSAAKKKVSLNVESCSGGLDVVNFRELSFESQSKFRTSEGVPLVTFTEMTDPAKIPIHGVKN